MNIFLLRHGLAVEPSARNFASDADRPLTPEGEDKLREIAQVMRRLEMAFDLVLSSPYLRARQTAEIVAAEFSLRKKLVCTSNLTPAGSTRKLLEEIRALHPRPEEVLLVGHEPYLSELISLLTSGSTAIPVVMKKAGLCKLSVETLRHGRCASLEWLLTPKQMLLMA